MSLTPHPLLTAVLVVCYARLHRTNHTVPVGKTFSGRALEIRDFAVYQCSVLVQQQP